MAQSGGERFLPGMSHRRTAEGRSTSPRCARRRRCPRWWLPPARPPRASGAESPWSRGPGCANDPAWTGSSSALLEIPGHRCWHAWSCPAHWGYKTSTVLQLLEKSSFKEDHRAEKGRKHPWTDSSSANWCGGERLQENRLRMGGKKNNEHKERDVAFTVQAKYGFEVLKSEEACRFFFSHLNFFEISPTKP